MSDGPYESLQMRKKWKAAAKCAHQEAFSEDDVANAVWAALHDDFQRELPSDFLKAIGDIFCIGEQGQLLSDQFEVELNAIRTGIAPNGLVEAILDHAELAAAEGLIGEKAMLQCIKDAAKEYGGQCARQIEEHYLREAREAIHHEKTASVRNRLDVSLASERVGRIGTEFVGKLLGKSIDPAPTKNTDIDAGPSLIR